MNTSSSNSEATRAWTLIELIAILAVMAILGAVILPMLIKETDKSVADQEKATLKSLADAFQQYVQATRVIPDQATWHSAVSSKLGLGINDILYNVRQQSHQQPRVFLIDPAFQVGLASAPSGLPYSQSNFISSAANSQMLPISPRLMIVASLGSALPNAVASGIFGNTTTQPYFNDLWTNADGTVPSDAAWAGWTGSPGDVVVQRIDLTPFFVHLWLGKYNSTNSGYYTVDGVDGVTTPTLVNTVDGFFIQGSVLGLYTNASGLDTKQILTRNSAFIFENGVWRGSLSGSSMAGGIGNIGDLAQQFLLAPPNVNAQNPIGNAQQALVVSTMLSYMSNYNVWSGQYSFNNANLKSYLQGIQGSMMSAIQGLYSSTYFPTNPAPCVR